MIDLGENQSYISLYKREVLLSYRFIFGQTRNARTTFRKSEHKRVPRFEGKYDPLLKVLCCKSLDRALHPLPAGLWLESWRDFAGNLLDQDLYSADADFPIFGSRLLDLQTFVSQQPAEGIWDMWRDRRNPAQWYTFWAVIILGGCALIIGIIQTVLAGVQIKLAE